MSKSWASTLRLPKSTFPPRPLAEHRPLYLQRSTDELYKWQQANRPDNDPFVVHDGPPYANGKLHVGHALNKILKDMSLRVKIQQGRRVHYRPGWDCHGLPIELKALATASESSSSSTAELTPVAIRKIARDLASRTIVDQMKEFRSFGVMADWDNRWTTMDPEYEVRQLQLFQTLVHKGLIYRKYKPVYWSPSSHTALAEAELEYNDRHVSTAAYVKFPILPGAAVPGYDGSRPLSAVIWTTTPWTLPANEAIAVHRDFEYVLVQLGDEFLLVADSCLESFTAACCPEGTPQPKVIVRSIRGSDLTQLQYTNPLRGKSAKPQPIIHADFVSAGSGSGLVHTAPGHGFDDYVVCMRLGLPIPAPVDGEGRFTSEAYPDDPSRLEGLSVQGEGNKAVLAILGDAVITMHQYRHKYPYDWRTKKPIIIRATAQWFADVDLIKDPAVASLKNVQFIPETGRSRLESFVKGRSEWCISRQRAWGVPIPALYGDDDSVVLTEETVKHILAVVKERGTDTWWSDAADEAAWIPEALRKANPGVAYRRGSDTMDVWFDSGSSWTQAANDAQADVYLEGSDQHRGWFQSSLLTRVAGLSSAATSSSSAASPATLSPFKTLVTHGFMLDGAGKKMSKSLGNIVTGAEVMEGTLLPPIKEKKKKGRGKAKAADGASPSTNTNAKSNPGSATVVKYDALGPDALRLWVAGSDYTGDVVMSEMVLQATHTALIKYRVTLKMLLGSMHESARTTPLTTVDHIALLQLKDTMKEVAAAYDRFEFYRGLASLNRWLTNDLSSFYLEAAKDRLYCADGGGVLEPIFVGLTRMLAPVVPMLVEEAWDHAPAWLKEYVAALILSCLLGQYTDTPPFRSTEHPLRQLYSDSLVGEDRLPRDTSPLRAAIPVIFSAHAAVKTALENARNDRVLGSPLQCSVVLRVPDDSTALPLLQDHAAELDSMFVVSSVSVVAAESEPATEEVSPVWKYTAPFDVQGGGSATAVVLPPQNAKCPRCWRYVAEDKDHLCRRCEDAVQQ
ncbi:isoleucyl-tRNA synthetase [Sporothrix schenckii 1099-18]|uniref:Isoleucine--tRNA ligase, mitochondrial n=1 Tax=Sporothrix schenckii 1099-18 TaxID=1397361 RepID=A0A0F2LXH4_SPOSC|nr:isoleucyl-tRNA synthetase [Sporothrix schenckii 1099-18]KJR81534.1 isoleucyl-tRNA synthetase [Sporothrix schenckii 1099-18]